MKDKTCSRCGTTLEYPIQAHANYVRADDFIVDEEVEVHDAYKHTQKTVKKVKKAAEKTGRDFQALSSDMAHPNAEKKMKVSVGNEKKKNPDGSTVKTAKHEEIDFSIPLSEFKKMRVETPEAIKDDDVALVETTTEKQPIQKMALVCVDCTLETDDIIWGPSK